ncbi:MAG: NYN domain-containing protein [Candidatus Aminicenantes bacterium]|nr:MAG: NYN domain-containing protein [Candidatus Aminicenantes bacterium]
MPPNERVAIFIDGSNLYHGLKNNIGNANIDFEIFCQHLVGSRHLTRVYYYNAPKIAQENPKGYKQQQSFFNRIKQVPFLELKLGRLVIRNNIPIEKGVDVLMTVDMIRYARNNAYDTAILVSGDGDFAPVLEFLKDFGKHIENAYFSKGRSINLSNHADRFINLDKLLWKKIFLKSK